MRLLPIVVTMEGTVPETTTPPTDPRPAPGGVPTAAGGPQTEDSGVRFWTQVKFLTVFLTAVSAIATAVHVVADSNGNGVVIVIMCVVVVAAALVFLMVPARVLATHRRRPLFFGFLAAGVSVLATALAWSDTDVVGAFVLLYVVAILIAGIAATRTFVVATGVLSVSGYVWLSLESDVAPSGDLYFGVVLLMLVLLTAAWGAWAQQDRTRRLVTLSDDVAKRMAIVQWITESTPAGICISDAEDRIVLANPAACEMLGLSEEELLGASAHETYHHSRPDGSPLSKEDCRVQYSLTDHVTIPISMVYWRPDGTSFDVEATSIPTPAGGVMVAFTDVSERLAAQRLKDQFMAVISHELRTPLTSVRGALGLMAGGAFGELPPGLTQMVEIAASNTDRLSRLINDVLDVERIASGNAVLQIEVFDVSSVVAATIEELRLVADEDGVVLTADSHPVTVFADADRVHQVMVNLLGNAIKFSDSGAEVAVRISTDGEVARIDVVDRGRGIPEALLENIFTPFEQVDASDARVKDGIGLGLAISEGIVRQHGGRIWAESEVGMGSTFSFTLPLAVATDMSSGRGHGERVLVIEGDDDVRASIAAMLDDGGYRSVTVATGRAGVEMAAREGPRAVVLGADLPDMDSWEVVRLLRCGAGTATVAIVLFGDITIEDRTHLSDVVQGFIDRGALHRSLLSTVESALRAAGPVVLIVEDDTDLAGVMSAGLAERGVESVVAASWVEAREWCEVSLPAVILLDLNLPDGSGVELLSWLHATNQFSEVGLAVYTATDIDVAQRLGMGLTRRDVFVKSLVPPEVVLERVLQLLDATTLAVAPAP